nr:DUF1329 domain-containing protein [Pseudomonas proteolytica]
MFPIVPVRYERHRVWEVEGQLKPGQRHIYQKPYEPPNLRMID